MMKYKEVDIVKELETKLLDSGYPFMSKKLFWKNILGISFELGYIIQDFFGLLFCDMLIFT